jgi:hypothetical protein
VIAGAGTFPTFAGLWNTRLAKTGKGSARSPGGAARPLHLLRRGSGRPFPGVRRTSRRVDASLDAAAHNQLTYGEFGNVGAARLSPLHAGIGLILFSLWTFAPSDWAMIKRIWLAQLSSAARFSGSYVLRS